MTIFYDFVLQMSIDCDFQDARRNSHYFVCRNFPQFPRTPAPDRDFPQDQFAPQSSSNNNVPLEPQRNQPPPPLQPPQPPVQPQQNFQPQQQQNFQPQQQQNFQPQQQNFGLPPQQQQQFSFANGPFTAFNNFPRVEQQQQQQQQQSGRAPGLGFEAVRNTVVHDSSSQSSSFFSFQRPEFQRPQNQPQQGPPTRFPVAERPSPVQPANFFGQFSGNLGSFVDPRSGSQRAQRALPEGASVPSIEDEVNRQLPNYRFPEPDFGGFVPMKRGKNSAKRY